MYQSLLNRNNYESSLSKANGNEKPKCKTKNLKFLSQAKLGAVNWNVEDYPDGENFDTAEARRTMLHSAYTIIQELQRPAPPDMHGDILINISLSFKLQREFFNDLVDLPTTESLLEKWPIFALKKSMFHHYSLQMGHSINLLKDGFNNAKEIIFSFRKA